MDDNKILQQELMFDKIKTLFLDLCQIVVLSVDFHKKY